MYASPHPEPVVIAVIGGSGVYKLDFLEGAKYYDIDTPFGTPSAPICVAKVCNVFCAFLPRHGVHHQLNPSEVNYRANICALKQLGVRYIIAINAAGSLDADYTPGDLVVCNQLVDRTVARKSTFFENGIVAHVDFAYPMSRTLNTLTTAALKDCFEDEAAEGTGKFKIHSSGTIVTMEGPLFSTKAESLLNKQLGGHLIGMTTSTEAKLAREAEIAYVTVAMVTDMDAWSDAPHVDTKQVLKTVAANAEKAQRYPPLIIRALAENLFDDPAHHALANAVMTEPEGISQEVRQRLQPILGKKYPKYAPKA
ncbi:putative Methylthioadenosine phosphorylase [Leptomonas pyrrhocoris]|uniref:Purine nucleoside phosphorylase n=1 Tax=Leptomonas pyrrhocoris TaxID=157538 RepID=A0A0M9FPM1_LEPPY|nr:putative Methylthioadenosine phosphorylase [Leptomonas pyrrhocoris]XP_015651778.1 putative Methylthioadenosine phosphorylase [Leptomonas pyrrhocoris]KPA73338.1 putative Methylthioadenosine phosphorylase [Leptomonas pyrrhocoris]KPA73339.1 putative Methylthioadenosine phosphorylase [Leptomonas pyrrhocoris]|eukprot:XP_015651777.1 putative Methylthioadenosine phosphorylase [Leptomonas pyrrhocoris]